MPYSTPTQRKHTRSRETSFTSLPTIEGLKFKDLIRLERLFQDLIMHLDLKFNI